MIIRKAENRHDLRSIWRLTYEAYHAQGYAPALMHGILAHYPHLDVLEETTIYMAEDNVGNLLGTVSFTMDGPGGLQVDEDFPEIVTSIRMECRNRSLQLGSPWRIATVPEGRNTLHIVMPLLDELTNHLVREKVDVCLFTFNPRHVKFYKKIWNLETIAESSSEAVENAPAVLMRGIVETMAKQWAKISQRRNSTRMKAVGVRGS